MRLNSTEKPPAKAKTRWGGMVKKPSALILLILLNFTAFGQKIEINISNGIKENFLFGQVLFLKYKIENNTGKEIQFSPIELNTTKNAIVIQNLLTDKRLRRNVTAHSLTDIKIKLKPTEKHVIVENIGTMYGDSFEENFHLSFIKEGEYSIQAQVEINGNLYTSNKIRLNVSKLTGPDEKIILDKVKKVFCQPTTIGSFNEKVLVYEFALKQKSVFTETISVLLFHRLLQIDLPEINEKRNQIFEKVVNTLIKQKKPSYSAYYIMMQLNKYEILSKEKIAGLVQKSTLPDKKDLIHYITGTRLN